MASPTCARAAGAPAKSDRATAHTPTVSARPLHTALSALLRLLLGRHFLGRRLLLLGGGGLLLRRRRLLGRRLLLLGGGGRLGHGPDHAHDPRGGNDGRLAARIPLHGDQRPAHPGDLPLPGSRLRQHLNPVANVSHRSANLPRGSRTATTIGEGGGWPGRHRGSLVTGTRPA